MPLPVLFPIAFACLLWLIYPYRTDAYFPLRVGGELPERPDIGAHDYGQPWSARGLEFGLIVGSCFVVGKLQHLVFEVLSDPAPQGTLLQYRLTDGFLPSLLTGLLLGLPTGLVLWFFVARRIYRAHFQAFLLSTMQIRGKKVPRYKEFQGVSESGFAIALLLVAMNWLSYNNYIRITPEVVEYRYWSDTAPKRRNVAEVDHLVWHAQRITPTGRFGTGSSLDIVFNDASTLDTSDFIRPKDQGTLARALEKAQGRRMRIDRRHPRL